MLTAIRHINRHLTAARRALEMHKTAELTIALEKVQHAAFDARSLMNPDSNARAILAEMADNE